jgi:cytochrome b subunit of formate dehydrogenase
MIDEKWKEIVSNDMKKCNEARVRFEEHDIVQEEDIKENKRLIEQLFDYKNNAQRDLTVLKTEKNFFPFLVMVVSAVVAVGTVLWQIFKAMSIG